MKLSSLIILSFAFWGCAKNMTRLESYHAIPVYGIDRPSAPKQHKFISSISVIVPIHHELSFFGNTIDWSINDALTKKALLLDANAVVNVRKTVVEGYVEDEFGKRKTKQMKVSGDAVYVPNQNKVFLTRKMIEVFNRDILGLPKMRGRDVVNNLNDWSFFLSENGDVICKELNGSRKEIIKRSTIEQN